MSSGTRSWLHVQPPWGDSIQGCFEYIEQATFILKFSYFYRLKQTFSPVIYGNTMWHVRRVIFTVHLNALISAIKVLSRSSFIMGPPFANMFLHAGKTGIPKLSVSLWSPQLNVSSNYDKTSHWFSEEIIFSITLLRSAQMIQDFGSANW